MNTMDTEKGWISIRQCSLPRVLLRLPSGGEFGGGLCSCIWGCFQSTKVTIKIKIKWAGGRGWCRAAQKWEWWMTSRVGWAWQVSQVDLV